MSILSDSKYLHNFLYNPQNGFLTQYHFQEGINTVQLKELYNILETLKKQWKDQDKVPKDIIFAIMGIIPALYTDLHLYKDREGFEDYEQIIYKLDTALMMCLNPNTDDPHFKKPIKDLCS